LCVCSVRLRNCGCLSKDPFVKDLIAASSVQAATGLGAVSFAEEPLDGPVREVAELLEIFQWLTEDQSRHLPPAKKDRRWKKKLAM